MGVAYELSKRSMALIEAKDRDGWLDLFSEDAIVEDPIGESLLDPEGKGHRGRTAIAAFYDNIISPSEAIEFRIKDTYDCGVEVANVGEIHITMGSKTGICRVVSTYRASPDGKLSALRAYWEIEKLVFE